MPVEDVIIVQSPALQSGAQTKINEIIKNSSSAKGAAEGIPNDSEIREGARH